MFFTNSGTEANELALLMARMYTGCQDIISVRNSYHGNAAGTMAATAQSVWKFNIVQVLRHSIFVNLIFENFIKLVRKFKGLYVGITIYE